MRLDIAFTYDEPDAMYRLDACGKLWGFLDVAAEEQMF